MKDLIDACMEADPEDRPSARDVVEFLSQQNERPVTGARRSRKQGVRFCWQPFNKFSCGSVHDWGFVLLRAMGCVMGPCCSRKLAVHRQCAPLIRELTVP